MLFLWMGAVCLIAIGGGLGRRLAVPDAVIWCALGFAAAFLAVTTPSGWIRT